jgi:hypothetical protein
MSKIGVRGSDVWVLGGMLVVLLVLLSFLILEAAKANWFTAIVLGLAVGPGICGVGGLLVYALRERPGIDNKST